MQQFFFYLYFFLMMSVELFRFFNFFAAVFVEPPLAVPVAVIFCPFWEESEG